MRYESATVPFGDTCSSEMQQALCWDGSVGSWSGGYDELTCMVQAPAACGDAAHGAVASRVRFATPTVPFKQTCASELQTASCDNGVLSHWSGTFAYETCTVHLPLGYCKPDSDGSSTSRYRFERELVPFGEACKYELQTRQCVDDEWTAWSGTFTAGLCTVAEPLSCGDVPHGTSQWRTRYAAQYGKPCKQESQSRWCDDGEFTEWSGTYAEDSCTEVECLPGEYRWTWPGECRVGYARATCEDHHWVWGECGRCSDPCVGRGSGAACLDDPSCTTHYDGKNVRCINVAKYDCAAHGLEAACVDLEPYCSWLSGGPYQP